MLHPDLHLELAKYEHQARITAVQRGREAGSARRVRPDRQSRWLAVIASRFRHPSGTGVRAFDVSDGDRGVTTAAAPPAHAVLA
ncbi:MAG TPA: hypothetical protein VLS53_07055 [Candidatus Dormibacteraeota bacterium]|nr:hypothetical protein [Candidatus Dormibacteraeota bacterium]